MKKLILSFLALTFYTTAYLQEIKKTESLDPFFAGIPLQKSYAEWVLHVTRNFSIDSTRYGRIHSSFKADTKDRFPFPDSIPVRIILYTGLKNIESARIADTVRSVTLLASFGTGKESKKRAVAFLKELRSLLTNNYRKALNLGSAWGFSDGINENFPDLTISLSRGHPPDNNSHYITIHYQHDSWIKY